MTLPDSIRQVIRGPKVMTAAGLRAAAIHVAGGRIAAVGAYQDVPAGADVAEAGDLVVFPGLVDTHVHINEPGRSDWEGFASATRAAAAGGVTTLLDMPLNNIPATTTVAALERKRETALGQCAVDVGFLGGVVPGNRDHLAPLLDAGVFGFKCFWAPSGIAEFVHLEWPETILALKALRALERPGDPGIPLMVHAETADGLRPAEGDPQRYATWLATRPARVEVSAVAALTAMARSTGARIHVVHVSAAESVRLLAVARTRGARISGETCPHYLGFAAEDIPDGATAFKCAPPIREAAHREALWRGLTDGHLGMVVSDHSPAPPALKQGDFLAAWGGIASLQLRLPAVWTGARARGLSLEPLAEWLCAAPARLVGLGGRKGSIEPGADCDLVLWDPDAEFSVDPVKLRHRHPLTPWAGRRLAGVVEATYLRGDLVYRRGAADGPPHGRLLSRND